MARELYRESRFAQFRSRTLQSQNAFGTIEEFVAEQQSVIRASFLPFYSRWRIQGVANQTTMQLQSADMRFFGQSRGQVGQGFNRVLTAADTSLSSGGGNMPGGQEFIATHLGVQFDPEMPEHIKRYLGKKGALRHKSGNAFSQLLGRVELWPAAEFGLQARSAATTAPSVTYQPSVNGVVGMNALPEGSELIFPENQEINLTLEVDFDAGAYGEDVYATTDNEPLLPNGDNALPEYASTLSIIMMGYLFEYLQ